jgi:hypothetical protein
VWKVDTQPAGAGRGDDNGDVPLALGHGVPCAPNTEPPACLGAARLCGESQGADGLGWRRKTPARHQMVRVRRYGIECGGRGLLLSNACANLLDRALACWQAKRCVRSHGIVYTQRDVLSDRRG